MNIFIDKLDYRLWSIEYALPVLSPDHCAVSHPLILRKPDQNYPTWHRRKNELMPASPLLIKLLCPQHYDKIYK